MQPFLERSHAHTAVGRTTEFFAHGVNTYRKPI
jgi:hypothetical protein